MHAPLSGARGRERPIVMGLFITPEQGFVCFYGIMHET